MHVTILILGAASVPFLKVFASLMIHRNGILREIKRLELRVAELPASLTSGK
jgi:hypothetical protein